MLTIPAGFNDTEVTSLQVCWLVVRRDGVEIRGTEWDGDLTITTGPYAGTFLMRAGITGSDVRSTSDLSVDNLEVTGALAQPTGDSPIDTSSLFLLDVSAADIEAGLLDNAEATTFLVNSEDPDLFQRVLRSGWIGNTTRTAEGQYKTELRGLTQALSQGIVKTYSVGCQWELFDSNCRADPTGHIYTRTVTVVTSRRAFQIDSHFAEFFSQIPGGKVSWLTGLNTGYVMEIKSYSSLQIELYLPMPEDITVGDTFTVQRGCDKTRETCINVYNNILNYGGWGVLVPGDFEILRVGKR